MPVEMKQEQDGQLGKVAESVVGKRKTALAGGEKIAPHKVLHLVRKCRHGKRQCQILQIRMVKEAAECLQPNQDQNEAAGD